MANDTSAKTLNLLLNVWTEESRYVRKEDIVKHVPSPAVSLYGHFTQAGG
jgi:hypothetical protein